MSEYELASIDFENNKLSEQMSSFILDNKGDGDCWDTKALNMPSLIEGQSHDVNRGPLRSLTVQEIEAKMKKEEPEFKICSVINPFNQYSIWKTNFRERSEMN